MYRENFKQTTVVTCLILTEGVDNSFLFSKIWTFVVEVLMQELRVRGAIAKMVTVGMKGPPYVQLKLPVGHKPEVCTVNEHNLVSGFYCPASLISFSHPCLLLVKKVISLSSVL